MHSIGSRRFVYDCRGQAPLLEVIKCKGESLSSCCNAAQLNLTDADILNFALNFEYLDSTYYAFATTGSDLPVSLLGPNPGTIIPGMKANLSAPIQVSACISAVCLCATW